MLNSTKVNINCSKSTWINCVNTIDIKNRTVNYEIIKRLVSEKTPLSAACNNSNIDIIKLLLNDEKLDADVPESHIKSDQSIESKTPLYLAVEKGQIDIVGLLLDYSDYDLECDVLYDGKHMSRKTPLFLAAESGRSDIIQFLLNNSKVDVYKMAEFDLLKVPNEGDPEKKTPLYIALENKEIDVIKALLNHDDIDVNLLNEIYKEGEYISYEVFEGNYVSYSVIKHRKAVLHYAVQNNLIEYVEILLDSPKTDVNLLCETCSTFWNTTSRNRNEDFSDIEEVVDIDDPFDENEVEKQAALHIAVKKKNIKMVKLLLSHQKIDVNALEIKNGISQTALYSAVDYGNVEMVELLLSKPEIDVNILCERDNIFQTALHFAVERRRTKIVKLLLSNPKIDVNIQRTNASCSNYYPNNRSNNNKMTALHIAYKEKCPEIVELLLQRKDIDVNIQDVKGKKPADYATK